MDEWLPEAEMTSPSPDLLLINHITDRLCYKLAELLSLSFVS